MIIHHHDSDFARYAELLGVRREQPSITALARVVRTHMTSVPFENVSKLYRLKTSGLRGIPDLAQYLEGIERFHFGGTCYSNNYYVGELLRFLGYDIRLCGADMSKPDVHMMNIVNVEGREFIVDAGYGAPFLEPLPRDLPVDYVISSGNDRYVLKPQNGLGRSELQLHRDGAFAHRYLVNPMSRTIDEFAGVILDSFSPEATFMNAILLVKCEPERTIVVHNMTCIENRGTTTERKVVESLEQLIQTIHDIFLMPRAIVETALDGLMLTRDAWN